MALSFFSCRKHSIIFLSLLVGSCFSVSEVAESLRRLNILLACLVKHQSLDQNFLFWLGICPIGFLPNCLNGLVWVCCGSSFYMSVALCCSCSAVTVWALATKSVTSFKVSERRMGVTFSCNLPKLDDSASAVKWICLILSLKS